MKFKKSAISLITSFTLLNSLLLNNKLLPFDMETCGKVPEHKCVSSLSLCIFNSS